MKTPTIITSFSSCIVSTGILISQILTMPEALAQITVDNTVGTQKIISEDGTFIIRGGEPRGDNLFHSFEQFSVPNGAIADFKNSSSINYIINRVTGSSLSNIEGTIRANGTASFILINPNGITFGPNAQINIKGSFLATTAEGITFADGVQFNATNAQPNPLLTMSVPVGLQFGSNPGTIVNQAENLVPSETRGTTFAFVGGNINFSGAILELSQGRIELGSVGSNSQVQLITSDIGFELGYEGVNNFQDISLSQESIITGDILPVVQVQGRNIVLKQSLIGSRIDEDGEIEPLETNSDLIVNASESLEIIGSTTGEFNQQVGLVTAVRENTLGDGGDIIVNTKKLVLRDGGVISAGTAGEGNSGSLEINALDSIQLIGTGFFEPSFLGTTTFRGEDSPPIVGNGGAIVINTKHLILQDGGQITAVTTSNGNAGTIDINATELVQVSGSGRVEARDAISLSRITSESGFGDLGEPGNGLGGNVHINTNQLIVTDGGIISAASLGQGNSGNLNITANSIFLNNQGTITASSQGTGDAGNLIMNTDQLTLNDRSEVTVRSIGTGDAGNVNIIANSIFLENQGEITASSEGTGNAGNLNINTDQLTVNERSEVAVRTIGTGQGGNLTVNARFISLDGKSQLTATSEALTLETALELGLDPDILELDNALANAGNLTITTNNLRVNNDSQVTVSSFGLGDAGNINVQAQNIFLDNSSRLSAETASGEGGNINLDVDQLLNLRRNSTISTTAGTAEGLGNGGNIDINTLFIITVPTENSDIVANAFLGRGGNINIDAAGVFAIEERERLTPLSDITASSQFGQVGNVGINRPDVDPQRDLVQLPEEVVDANNVVIDACRPGGALTRGEFTIRGRGGLPSNPTEGVNNPTGLTELGYPNTDSLNSIPLEPNRSSSSSEENPNQSETHTPTLVEAQGWIINADGNVVLTAKATTVTPHSPGLSPATCYDLSTRNSSP